VQAGTACRPVNQVSHGRTGYAHGKDIGPQGGQAPVGQENGLVDQDDDRQNGGDPGAEDDCSHARARWVGAAAGYGGKLEGGENEDEGSGHSQKGQGLAALLDHPVHLNNTVGQHGKR